MKRVLSSLHAITEWPQHVLVLKKLWSLAEHYTPTKRIADYTQAMMDLGATICRRGTPRCTQCPLTKYCLAHEKGIEKKLPATKPRKTLPIHKNIFLILIKNQHEILLKKTPPSGSWGSLWCLPKIADTISTTAIKRLCKKDFACEVKKIQERNYFRHTFTHFHLEIKPVVIHVKYQATKMMDDAEQIWYNAKSPEKIGLPAPIKKLLEEFA